MSEENRQSEELFETLSKNKKKRKRKLLRTVLIIIALVAVTLLCLVLYFRGRVDAKFAAPEADVLRYEVKTGTIHTVVSGSGTLAQVDVEEITVPQGVEVTEVMVESRDTVNQGDILATVDMATVMTALADVQEQLDELDDEIADAKDDTVSATVTAGVPGRVKRLLAEKDTDVTACMAEHGALAYLSLDGYMAADLETEALTKGMDVTVRRADGTVLTGLVDAAIGGRATVLVTDNGPQFDEEVTILLEDAEIGKAKLYIHSPLAVTGYAGTVSGVSSKENAKVSGSTAIFTLKNTRFSANYDTLLRSRQDLEETLMDLLTIYRYGALAAPFDGSVSAVLFDEELGKGQTSVLTLYPNREMSVTVTVDETDILALKEGQEAEVVVSSVSEELFPGTVTDISKEANTSSGVTVYSAEITLGNAPGMLPGMTAEVDVKIEGVENAMIIPLEALHKTSAISFVYTTFDPETQQYGGMVEVTTGMQNDTEVEVLSGLNVGDTLFYTETEDFFTFFMNAMTGGGMGGGSRSAAAPAAPSGGRPGGNFGG